MKIVIEVTKEGSKYVASGSMTSGEVKMMVGQLESIKLKLLQDLHDSEDDKVVKRFEQ